MKKTIYLLIVLLFTLVGCKKNSVTLNDFILKAEDNAYYVESNKTGYENYQYIKEIYYAVNRENAYDIQFLELESDDYAKKFFLLNANDLRSKITDKDYIKSKSLSSYELFHAEDDEKYYLVIRSNNNIIYIDAPIDYINEIEEFLSDLNLEY